MTIRSTAQFTLHQVVRKNFGQNEGHICIQVIFPYIGVSYAYFALYARLHVALNISCIAFKCVIQNMPSNSLKNTEVLCSFVLFGAVQFSASSLTPASANLLIRDGKRSKNQR